MIKGIVDGMRQRNAVPLCVLLATFLVPSFYIFQSGLLNLFERWQLQPAYSHGYLLPLVSGYIVFENRWKIASDWGSYPTFGVLFILLSLAGLLVGELSALFVVIQYSYIVYLVGVVALVFGPALKYFFAPFVILCFGVPLPYFFEALITSKMQLVSSWLGVEIIRFCNIPVLLQGNIIDLGIHKLQVVEACSGLRYLFPLMSIGFIVAYFYDAPIWRRTFVFIATVPITIIMNSVRVAISGILVVNWGSETAEGFMHDFEGWVIFLVCGLLLLSLVFLMEQITSKRSLFDVLAVISDQIPDKSEVFPGIKTGFYIVAGFSAIIGYSIVTLGDHLDETQFKPTAKSLAGFPERLGGWLGKHHSLSSGEIAALKLTDYSLLDYENEESKIVNFYTAYYSSQSSGNSPHSPSVCIPGGGWEILSLSRGNVSGIPINRVVIQKGENSQVVYYWFEERGQAVANEYYKKWLLLKDSINSRRSDGALVRLTTPVYRDEAIEDAEVRLKKFLPMVREQLAEFLPQR